jgi:hypothetical protein
VFSIAFIAALILAVFAVDLGKRWWEETSWRRRWRRKKPDED